MEKKKNVLIAGLLAVIVFMSVGYAALAQVLTINGTANIDASWDVEITNIELLSSTDAADHAGTSPSYTATSATFNVDLQKPGAVAIYNVTVENKGSIDAELESILGLDTANAAAPAEIVYTVNEVAAGDVLAAGDTQTVQVKVEWTKKADNTDVIPTVKAKTATITLNYVQD